MKREVDLSVIVPVSERFDNVSDVYHEYDQALKKWGQPYELIYVLDGEFPQVYAELCQLQDRASNLRVVKLAKSFGEATALTAGFEHANGETILSLPAYLQIEADAIPEILDALAGNDMVIGRRWPRVDSLANRVQSFVFHRLVRFITGSTFHDLGCGARAFRRQVMQEVPVYGDQHRFLPLLALKRGFRVEELAVKQSQIERFTRLYRPGIYLRRVLDLLTVFFLIKFTKKPLRFFGLIGTTTTFAGGLVVLYVVLERLLFAVPLAERPALLLGSLLMVLGVQVFGLGLIGELIIFTHAKEIKEYTIEEIVN